MAEFLVTVPKEARTTLFVSSKLLCCSLLLLGSFYVGIMNTLGASTRLKSNSTSIPPMLGDLKGSTAPSHQHKRCRCRRDESQGRKPQA